MAATCPSHPSPHVFSKKSPRISSRISAAPPRVHTSLAPTTDTATPTQPRIPKPTGLAVRKQTKATATTATRTKTKAENEGVPQNPLTAAAHQPQNHQEQASPSTTSPASSPHADKRSPSQNLR